MISLESAEQIALKEVKAWRIFKRRIYRSTGANRAGL